MKVTYKQLLKNQAALSLSQVAGIPGHIQIKLIPALETLQKHAELYNDQVKNSKPDEIQKILETDFESGFEPICPLDDAITQSPTATPAPAVWAAARALGIFS